MYTKWIFNFLIVFFAFIIFANTSLVFASGIDMNLSNNTNNSNIDDTVYGSNSNNSNTNTNSNSSIQTPNTPINVGSSGALSSSNLSLPTIINIILIVIGILLLLLGIAILIRLR